MIAGRELLLLLLLPLLLGVEPLLTGVMLAAETYWGCWVTMTLLTLSVATPLCRQAGGGEGEGQSR